MRRWNADRSAAITADGEGTDARGNRGAGSRTGAAWRQLKIPWIARGFENRIVADAAVAEFRDIGLANDNRPRLLQPFNTSSSSGTKSL
jgi:hypothetical protein